ncbi:hypothetical protein Sste5346_008101 [Sporothrix stenoceras]|uniref:ABC transporter domain-containing protein n=1 Tax=Sporothrix stenoceras TaxID=5173 RepID=A0ABR3YR25_9PEZI
MAAPLSLSNMAVAEPRSPTREIDEPEYDYDDAIELGTISRIATGLQSRHGVIEGDAPDKSDPRLDPSKPEFDHYRWAQMVLQTINRQGIQIQEQGVAFSDLCVSGSGASLQYQQTVVTTMLTPFSMLVNAMPGRRNATERTRILRGFDGTLESGELLLVLGRPGSGCSTFLKTICGHLGGLTVEPCSEVQFRSISYKNMFKHYRGEVAYNQEVDEHFPHLTVGETLSFAASARAPQQRPAGITREEYVETIVKVVMAVFGLSHTYNTKVGNNFVRGISGGERKRVSIAEMFLSRTRIGAWDNSTRGLDSASALQFVKSLRLSADLGKTCHAVAAYQASQLMYDEFDKVVLLYEGYEIYYGPCDRAVQYFMDMGWDRNPQQVSPDFLTAITNPTERRPREGMESKVPRTATEFAECWKNSAERQATLQEVANHRQKYPINDEGSRTFHENHKEQQARHTRAASPYLLSPWMQVRLCLKRAFQRMRNDLPATITTVGIQIILALIIGSVFFNSPNDTSSFFQKGAVIFFAVLMNALITVNEILQMYDQRPIVQKHLRYAFVHPYTESVASLINDTPVKLFRCSIFSVILYFMANLRREAGNFFIFYLFLTIAIFTMSGIFRSLAAATKTVGQAMGLAGIMVITIVIYTGFTLPQTYMHPWFAWLRWLNPIYYAFEALMSNEFHGRTFPCTQTELVPIYGTGDNFVCAAVGGVAGQREVSGDRFLELNYGYTYSHLWRNLGIMIGFLIAFHVFYMVATELNRGSESKAEALVFRPGHAPVALRGHHKDTDAESVTSEQPKVQAVNAEAPAVNRDHLPVQKDILMWKGLQYDIPVKEGTRRLLDDVNGWVKPGTLTALMGVSGAGKTTLLDVLAQRVSIGVVSGDILINGKMPTSSFPRRTGYVQQQDLHLETTTVREALRFSAILRQPRSVSKAEKYATVEEVIQMLGMQDFAEAVVGSLGEGLNVEQRKLLSIGVELAAKPTLLIFLDEPTSGLDSQSSWTICQFLRKLVDNGQAILATIHQPSALLFQTFDRLLFLAKGGRTVYFGNIGPQSKTLRDYFTRCGARPCGDMENPAEYILNMVSGDGAEGVDFVGCWNTSPERTEVLAELGRLYQLADRPGDGNVTQHKDLEREFAQPFWVQFHHVVVRAFQQYFRQPDYIYSKFLLGIVTSLFIGFSFWKANSSMQGFQNALFSIFLLCTIFSTLVNQIMPKFVVQRSLYEVREKPSRVYSWQVFVLSRVVVEIPWQILLGIIAYASFYYSVFGVNTPSESQGLILLFIVQFYIYAASMAQMVIAAINDPHLGAIIAIFMFGLSFIFNGVLQPPSALPGFWIFMYRVSPFTYYIGGISGTALHGRAVICSAAELSVFSPPSGYTCGQYMGPYLQVAPGNLTNPDATSNCKYCSISNADQYLAGREIYYSQRWRNYGIFWAYFVFNVFGTFATYYIFRVKSWHKKTGLNLKSSNKTKKTKGKVPVDEDERREKVQSASSARGATAVNEADLENGTGTANGVEATNGVRQAHDADVVEGIVRPEENHAGEKMV